MPGGELVAGGAGENDPEAGLLAGGEPVTGMGGKSGVVHARNARVTFRRTRDRFVIRVEDDGVGFEAAGGPFSPRPTGGFGLFSVAAQMRGIGGRLAIGSSPGAGAWVELRVALSQAGAAS